MVLAATSTRIVSATTPTSPNAKPPLRPASPKTSKSPPSASPACRRNNRPRADVGGALGIDRAAALDRALYLGNFPRWLRAKRSYGLVVDRTPPRNFPVAPPAPLRIVQQAQDGAALTRS